MMTGRVRSPAKNELRQLLALAIPVTVVQVGMMTLGVVDIAMVGHLPGNALAAVALGSLHSWAILMFGFGLVLAADPIISQAFGARDESAIRAGVQRGVWIALLVALPLTLLHYAAGPVLTWLGQPAQLIGSAIDYAWAVAPSTPAFLLFVLGRVVLQATDSLRPIVITIVVANGLNALLNWALIFGNWGCPALGVVGAGIATTIARWFMVLFLFWLSWTELRPRLWPVQSGALAVRPMLAMLALGLPIAIQFELEIGVFSLVLLQMHAFGDDAVAGHQVAINLASLSFMVPLGISTAAAVRVGHMVGAGDGPGTRRAALTAISLGMAVMALFALLFLIMPRALTGLYCRAESIAVLDIAASLLPIAGVFQVFDGLQVVSIGVLRGLGDTRAPAIMNIFGFWLLGAPAVFWLGFGCNLGPAGMWWGLVIGLAAVALLLLGRVFVRLRRGVERIEGRIGGH